MVGKSSERIKFRVKNSSFNKNKGKGGFSPPQRGNQKIGFLPAEVKKMKNFRKAWRIFIEALEGRDFVPRSPVADEIVPGISHPDGPGRRDQGRGVLRYLYLRNGV